MSRVYRIFDVRGERTIDELQLPLSLGGADVADIVLADCPPDVVAAYIGLSDGHAFVQLAESTLQVFHNHHRLHDSAWLKSGDQVEFNDSLVDWQVKGDQVQILARKVSPHSASVAPGPPPLQAPLERPPLPRSERTVFLDRHRTLKRVVAGTFVLLVLLAAFVLIATPVAIRISPAPAEQSLTGFPPPLPFGQRLLLWPGRYRMHARLEGYHDLDEGLDVPMGGFLEFDFPMQELPGLLQLQIQPEVVFELRVDGQPVQVDGDQVARVERGGHRLAIHSERYLVAEQQVEVDGFGKSQVVRFVLEPGWADVSISTVPAGASVQVDGVLLGDTPLSAELLQGTRTVTLEKALYKTASLQPVIVAGQPLALQDLPLLPADGQLLLRSSPDAATIQVNGEYRGTTAATLTLPSATEHRLRLSKPGYRVLEHSVRLEPEQQQILALELEPEYGTLFISSDPADAEIRVDGKKLGKATRRLRLTTRPHRLEIYKPGYVTHTTTTTPRAGISQNLDVTLKAVGQPEPAIMPETVRSPAGQLLRLVRPQGRFEMGASRREAGRRSNESRRSVQLVRPFYLGEKEVSNAGYRRFKKTHNSGSRDGAGLDGDDQPVAGISWDDAARYCNWLSKQQGLPAAYREEGGRLVLKRPVNTGYRLPTEAEWAYVARVLSRNAPARYPWTGSWPPTSRVGNFADARISDTLAEVVPNYDDQYRGSAPVGSFAAFPSGFYDLGGNAAEWTGDFYTVYPGAAGEPVKDPLGPSTGKHHVVRGSSWRHGNITELRLSYRDYSSKPRSDLGFRLARYAD